MDIQTRLQNLRERMQTHQLDFYFVPSADAHNNEYLPDAWQRRAWVSNFDGSAGDALVGCDNAYLWTDARYFLQAEEQLDSAHYTLMKQIQGASPIDAWLKENAPGKTIGVDPKVISIATKNRWLNTFDGANTTLNPVAMNLVDEVWEDAPTLSSTPVRIQDIAYAGVSASDKISQCREILADEKIDAHVVTMLDAIAWLFNIRGEDIDFNPLVISYALITQDEAIIFIDPAKLDENVRSYFDTQNIIVKHYDEFASTLQALKSRVLIDPATASWWIEQQLENADIVYADSPITLMKAIKNPTEVNGMIEAHRRDALALARFFHWLSLNWQGQTEISAADQLESFRRQDPHCHGLSFTTISSFADHAAVIHYSPTPKTDLEITDQNIYLVDSGGQYDQGTTDVTRTIHLGTPTQIQREHYTAVLKGHLGLGHSLFPNGTTGEQLNAIAHLPLWLKGLDFGHGTGHGVGCYLCVHEGPHRIAGTTNHVPMLPGMMVSNEPGLYLTGQYGIRIENICAVESRIDPKDSLTGDGPFYGFKALTLAPYARNLIDKDALTRTEIAQIDAYHAQIYDTLADDLEDEVREWLREATLPL